MALRAGPVGLPQDGGGAQLGLACRIPFSSTSVVVFVVTTVLPGPGESSAGGWQLAVRVLRGPARRRQALNSRLRTGTDKGNPTV